MEAFIDSLDKREGTIIKCPTLYSKANTTYTWRIEFKITHNNKEYDFSEFDNILNAEAKIPKSAIFTYYIIYGQDKKRIDTREVLSGKNIGKKNETTLLEQGLKDIYSLYTKKLMTYKNNKEDNSAKIINITTLYKINKSLMVYGMNLYKYEPKYVKTFPVLIQPKLNGLMCMLIYTDITNNCLMYSRQLKVFNDSVAHIKKEYINIINVKNVYFVGELYIHGLPLQDIISFARTNKCNDRLTYNIFDYFIIGDKVSALDRQNKITYYSEIFNNKLHYIKFIVSELANNHNDIDAIQKKYIKDGYEGAVLRIPEAPYEYGIDKPARSRVILKYKTIFEDEFPLVGYTSDTYDGIVFICGQSNKLNNAPLDNRLHFNVVPNWTTENRKVALKKMNDKLFAKKYYGHMVKVYYNDISKDGIPLQAKMEIFVEQHLYDMLIS